MKHTTQAVAFAVGIVVAFALVACGKKKDDDGHADAAPSPNASTATQLAASAASSAAMTPPTPMGSTSGGMTASSAVAVAVAVPPGAPPADGKYERVTIDGVTVPMIEVMNKGAVVLVDTDGKKPRSWEEQYKRKRELPNGEYDVHKTNTNKNDTFEDDTIDKEGLWVIDAKGNLTKH